MLIDGGGKKESHELKKILFCQDIISTFIVSDYNDHFLINEYYAYIPV